tara:strand:- start:551 stop:790 length:240 start_codon:yes stop_codon:yes gene_type:complete
MKQILSLGALIIILICWNYFPYSEYCVEYPLTGCDYNDFWWNLPSSASEYRGINWGGYFFANIFYTIIIVVIYSKVVPD